MFGCLDKLKNQNMHSKNSTIAHTNLLTYRQQCHLRMTEYFVTAIALAAISLMFIAVGQVLYGAATLPPEMINGLGIFPYLIGALSTGVAFVIGGGCVIFAALGVLRGCQYLWYRP